MTSVSTQGGLVEFTPETLRAQKRKATFVAVPVMGIMRLAGATRVLGTENIPAEGPAILVAYHASNLDPLTVGVSVWKQKRLVHFMAKDSLFKGLLGKVLRPLGQIPVVRNSAQAGDSLLYAKQALEAGATIVVYPQGTLTKDPELWPQESKTGAARLALATGAPLIPVSHWGLQEVMGPHATLPALKPRNRVTVKFGTPIDYSDVSDDRAGLQILSRRITAHIARGVAELRGEPLPEKFVNDLEDPS